MNVREVIENLNGEHKINSLSKVIGIAEKKLSQAVKDAGGTFDNSSKQWTFEGEPENLEKDISSFVSGKVRQTAPKRTKNEPIMHEKEPIKNEVSTQQFTEREVIVLKRVAKEHETKQEVPNEYQIYTELAVIPREETIRSAYNLTKTTTNRLKKFSTAKKVKLQEVVELALIKFLDEYQDK